MKIPPPPNLDNGLPPAKRAVLNYYLGHFDALVPGERDCFAALLRRFPDGRTPVCGACGCMELLQGDSERVRKCKNCKKEVWLTAGGFFAGIRAARPWYLAIWLKEQGVSFNAADLHRMAGIAASTAGKILKKIHRVLLSHMETEANAIEVYSAIFAPVVCKRSLVTPAKEHPTAEQDDIENQLVENEGTSDPTSTASGASAQAILNAAARNALSGHDLQVYELLSKKPVDFETLRAQTNIAIGPLSATLSRLELEELIERLAGDSYVRADTPSRIAFGKQAYDSDGAPVDACQSVAESMSFVRSGFHGVSRKYLQLYLAAYWCHTDRTRWSPDELLKACCSFREVTSAELRAFVSPLFVKLVPA